MWGLYVNGGLMFRSDSADYLRGLRDGIRMSDKEHYKALMEIRETSGWRTK